MTKQLFAMKQMQQLAQGLFQSSADLAHHKVV